VHYPFHWTVIWLLGGIVWVAASLFVVNESPVQGSNVPLTWLHLSTANNDLPNPSTSTEQTTALVFDIDNDGDNDFVIGSRHNGTPSVVWYQRTASGWTRYLIDSDLLYLEAGGAFFDIDGDGDQDLVIGGDRRSNKIWWWENPHPQHNPTVGWTRREIKNSGSARHHDQIFGDFDGDGRAELVFWNQNAAQLVLAEIPADPKAVGAWPQRVIYSWSDKKVEEGLAQADIDGDGLMDIIGAGKWFKYNANGSFTPHVIDNTMRYTRVAVGQLIPGGRPEVVFAAGDWTGPFRWYAWNGSTWVTHNLITGELDRGHSLDLADFNQDGHLDIFVAEMRLNGQNSDAATWIFLGDGQGGFTRTTVATGFDNHEARVADLDNDGDLDILGKPYNHNTPQLNIWLNQLIPNDLSTPTSTPTSNPTSTLNLTATPTSTSVGCTSSSWARQVIDSAAPWRTLFVETGDLDGDGWPDLATGGWWYKNPGPTGGAWVRNAFGAPLNNLAVLYDFDGDGDLDALGTQGEGSTANADFAWARNDGNGLFTLFTNIEAAEGNYLQGAVAGRFRNNATIEVALSWHRAGEGIQLLTVPAEPSTTTWAWNRVSPVSQDEGLSVGDIDRDGDLDLLLGTQWLRNEQDPAGGPSTWQPFMLFTTDELPDRNRLADLNGDGRLDAIVGYERVNVPAVLAWYEQPADPTMAWTEHIIDTPIGPMSLDVADMDGDGDLDIVVGEHYPQQPAAARLLIYENLDSQGGSWQVQTIATGDEHHNGAQVVDLNGDGALDLVSIGWNHRNVLRYTQPTCIEESATPTATATQTPTATGTPTATATETRTPTETPIVPPSPTVTITAPLTPTATLDLSPTATVSPTLTPTATLTATTTPTDTPTPTASPTATEAPPTPTDTPTATPTLTNTPAPTATPTPGDQCSPLATNLLRNGNFEQGTSEWAFYTNGTGTLSTGSPAYACTVAATIRISKAGTNVQFYQAGFALEPQTHYRLTFAAYSSTGRDLAVHLHQHSGSANYGLQNVRFDLQTSWRLFTVDFTTSGFSEPTTDTRLRFWLAPYDAAKEIYWFDDVRLERLAPAVTSADQHSGPPAAGAVLAPVGSIRGSVAAAASVGLAHGGPAQLLLADLIHLGTQHTHPLVWAADGEHFVYQVDNIPRGDYVLTLANQDGEALYRPVEITVRGGEITALAHELAHDAGPESVINALFLPVITANDAP
jgi:hypothetical protein